MLIKIQRIACARLATTMLGLVLVVTSRLSFAQPDSFAGCIAGLQQQARLQGLSAHTVEQVLPGLQQQEKVLQLDAKQPEFSQSFAEYFLRRVSDQRIEQGRLLYRQYGDFLAQLAQQYGVPGQYLLAFWGLETNFGSYKGNSPTLDSLATLACDPRRSDFFTAELLHALQLMEAQHLEPEQMRGSWAGAVGHTQFMPSNYRRYAVDGDGDGRAHLWQSERDALASAANFLQQLGWQREQRWGREVLLPKGFDYSLANDQYHGLAWWRQQGLRRADGATLPVAGDMQAQLVVPAGHLGPAFLVYQNFQVIMGWNRSVAYALSVGHLADRIAGAGGLYRPPPTDTPRLTRAQVQQLQQALLAQGIDVGSADGIMGPSTQRGLQRFQQQAGLVADGYIHKPTLQALGVTGFE